jgi:hypothetical protein
VLSGSGPLVLAVAQFYAVYALYKADGGEVESRGPT